MLHFLRFIQDPFSDLEIQAQGMIFSLPEGFWEVKSQASSIALKSSAMGKPTPVPDDRYLSN